MLTVALVDVAASIAAAHVLVKVGAQISALRGVRLGLVDFLLDGGEIAMRRSIRSTTRMPTRRRSRGLGRHALFFHQGSGNPEVSHGRISFRRGVVLLETWHSRTQVGLRAVEHRQHRLCELEA
jgi:hypothetical protein